MPTVEELLGQPATIETQKKRPSVADLLGESPDSLGMPDFSRMPQQDVGQQFAAPVEQPMSKEQYDSMLRGLSGMPIIGGYAGAKLGLGMLSDASAGIDADIAQRRQEDFEANDQYADPGGARLARRGVDIATGVSQFVTTGVPQFFDRIVNPARYQSTLGEEGVGLVKSVVEAGRDYPAVLSEIIGSTMTDLETMAGNPNAGARPLNMTDLGSELTNMLGGDAAAVQERVRENPAEVLTTPMMWSPAGALVKRGVKGFSNYRRSLNDVKPQYDRAELLKDVITEEDVAAYKQERADIRSYNKDVYSFYRNPTELAEHLGVSADIANALAEKQAAIKAENPKRNAIRSAREIMAADETFAEVPRPLAMPENPFTLNAAGESGYMVEQSIKGFPSLAKAATTEWVTPITFLMDKAERATGNTGVFKDVGAEIVHQEKLHTLFMDHVNGLANDITTGSIPEVFGRKLSTKEVQAVSESWGKEVIDELYEGAAPQGKTVTDPVLIQKQQLLKERFKQINKNEVFPMVNTISLLMTGENLNFVTDYSRTNAKFAADLAEGKTLMDAIANAKKSGKGARPELSSQKSRTGKAKEYNLDQLNNELSNIEAVTTIFTQYKTSQKINKLLKETDLATKDPSTAYAMEKLQRRLLMLPDRMGPSASQAAKWFQYLNRNFSKAALTTLNATVIQPSVWVNTMTELVRENPHPYKTLISVLDDLTGDYAKAEKIYRRVLDQSDVILNREFESNVYGRPQDTPWTQGSAMYAVAEGLERTADKMMAPMKHADRISAIIAQEVAYRAATERGMSRVQANQYADNMVTRTQGSGNRFAVSAIQRNKIGKVLSGLQTFAINESNYYVRDILMQKGVPAGQRAKVMTHHLMATFVANALYDQLFGITPLPSPVYGAMQAATDDDDETNPLSKAGLEALQMVPLVGGSAAYSLENQWQNPLVDITRFFGPGVNNAVKTITSSSEVAGQVLSDEEVNRYKLKELIDAWMGVAGVPGAREVTKRTLGAEE